MVQTILLSYQSDKNCSEWFPSELSLSTGAARIVRSFTNKNLMSNPEKSDAPASIGEDGPPAPATASAPKFPSPSECSKWLMLFWFAGFDSEKIRLLLSKYFKLDGHKAYDVKNIESTFRQLQRSADRNTGDYKTDPYMYYIMTSKSSSPFEFRQSAIRWLEKHHPKMAEDIIGDVEIKEMNCWHQRWTEEVQLMKKSKAQDYCVRAAVFQEKLDHYAPHFDTKGYTAYLENNQGKSCRKSKSAAPSPERKSSTTSTRRSEDIERRSENTKITNIQRPQLTVRTRLAQVFTKSKEEGTPTPSTAQHLDDLGFFAHRPAPSAASVVGARSRTPSLQSADSVSLSSASLSASLHKPASR